MLKITYQQPTSKGQTTQEYQSVDDFLQGQFLEVPMLPDHYLVTKVILDGKELQLNNPTIEGLFNLLNSIQ
ncbi:hypothetical protein [Enterococcus sp. AZ012]|uniref:hypothetical protein n=1 Tax=unclassified Enterococcus TaxID=2608891 RepID=UPI003D2E649E